MPDRRICLSFKEPVKHTASKTSLNGKKLTILKKQNFQFLQRAINEEHYTEKLFSKST
jgi:hypothetical protein